MSRFMRCVIVASLVAASAAADEPTAIKERKGFIPWRKHLPLKGTVIGLMVNDGQPILTTEGRSGPPDQLCFAADGASYRWVYVPTFGVPMITNLQVPVGEKGEVHVFPSLNMASLKNVAGWGVTKPCTLVEVQVNTGHGSPAGDSFVATQMKVLEGSKDYPLKVTDAVDMLRKEYAAHLKKVNADIESAMTDAGKKALAGRKPTGPREKSDLVFLTWLTGPERLRVHFRTQISDGAYENVEGGGAVPVPLPLPPPQPGAQPKFKLPPPPPRFRVKTGVTFGVELGMAHEVSKEGKLVRSEVLPIAPFQRTLEPVPGAGGGPRLERPR